MVGLKHHSKTKHRNTMEENTNKPTHKQQVHISSDFCYGWSRIAKHKNTTWRIIHPTHTKLQLHTLSDCTVWSDRTHRFHTKTEHDRTQPSAKKPRGDYQQRTSYAGEFDSADLFIKEVTPIKDQLHFANDTCQSVNTCQSFALSPRLQSQARNTYEAVSKHGKRLNIEDNWTITADL